MSAPTLATPAPGSPGAGTEARPQSYAGTTVPAAVLSVATAVVVLLTGLDGMLLRSHPGLALLTATVVTVGSGGGIITLHRRGYRGVANWLTALGGMTLLGVGLLHGLSQVSSVGMIETWLAGAAAVLVPGAAVLCFLGGLGQFPRASIPAVGLGVGGASLIVWASMGPFFSPGLCVLGAVLVALAVGRVLVRARRSSLGRVRFSPPVFTLFAGFGLAIGVLCQLVALTLFRSAGQAQLNEPDQLVWGLLAATILVVLTVPATGRAVGLGRT